MTSKLTKKRKGKMKKIILIATSFLMLIAAQAANAAIVNINARSATPIELFLDAGTYVVKTIGTAGGGLYDAWSPWNVTLCADPAGCLRTSPSTSSGWITDYNIASPDITDVSVEGNTLLPVSSEPNPKWQNYFLVTTGQTFYHVAEEFVYPDALTALSHAQSSTFTLSNSGVVSFLLTDTANLDNRGGMSLSVNAVPIPAAVWLFGSGLIGLIGVARRKKA